MAKRSPYQSEAIDKIVAWVNNGAREGDAKDLPAMPEYTHGWRIGKPDETFSAPEQAVPADGIVDYQYLTVPTNFKEDRWITSAEIRSSAGAVVHHVIVFVQSRARLVCKAVCSWVSRRVRDPTISRPVMRAKFPLVRIWFFSPLHA